jgi:hypothetical protein
MTPDAPRVVPASEPPSAEAYSEQLGVAPTLNQRSGQLGLQAVRQANEPAYPVALVADLASDVVATALPVEP